VILGKDILKTLTVLIIDIDLERFLFGVTILGVYMFPGRAWKALAST
jgi:hypothetical protein